MSAGSLCMACAYFVGCATVATEELSRICGVQLDSSMNRYLNSVLLVYSVTSFQGLGSIHSIVEHAFIYIIEEELVLKVYIYF